MRLFFLILVMCLLPISLMAQDEQIDKSDERKGLMISQLYLETRLGFEWESIGSSTISEHTGFRGQYLNFRLDGQIVKGLSYSFRHRLNKNTSSSFFDATDWAHLDWTINDKFVLSAGKQVVAIGGYEYDRAPIDLYYNSEFWNHIACYQLGVSARYQIAPANSLLLQFCNSPFRALAGNNTYGINLMWSGKVGLWETLWSANIMQYTKKDWMNYVALGNRFHLGNRIRLDVDVMNRMVAHQKFFSNYSIMTELSANPTKGLTVFGKYTFDKNSSGLDADYTVLDGTEISLISAGVEYSPIKNYREYLRLFAAAAYSWGENGNADSGVLQDKQTQIQVGIKWKLDVLDSIKRIKSHPKK